MTHGSRAVERVQKETVGRPLALLELVPVVAPLAKVAHVVHDIAVSGVHGTIRLVARVAGGAVDLALEVVDAPASSQYPGGRPPPGPPPKPPGGPP